MLPETAGTAWCHQASSFLLHEPFCSGKQQIVKTSIFTSPRQSCGTAKFNHEKKPSSPTFHYNLNIIGLGTTNLVQQSFPSYLHGSKPMYHIVLQCTSHKNTTTKYTKTCMFTSYKNCIKNDASE